MIEYLDNWTFFILALTSYLVIIMLSAKWLKVFKYIASLKLTKDLVLKINRNKIYAQIKDFVNDKLKPIYIFAAERIFSPAINFTADILQISSKNVSFAGDSTEIYLAEIISEGFEMICILTRRLVYSETRSIWTAFLAIIVLIYIILTNL